RPGGTRSRHRRRTRQGDLRRVVPDVGDGEVEVDHVAGQDTCRRARIDDRGGEGGGGRPPRPPPRHTGLRADGRVGQGAVVAAGATLLCAGRAAGPSAGAGALGGRGPPTRRAAVRASRPHHHGRTASPWSILITFPLSTS